MTDKELCELLRINIPYEAPRCLEAADRIEELTTEAAENARIIGMSAEREMALRGEVERLRRALEKVTDHGDLAAVQIARAALGDEA
jgi:hypothetical protein